MTFDIRDVSSSDLDAALMLNESEVPAVSSIDMEQMRWFADCAAYFRVAMSGEDLAAFLIGLRPATEYASPNFRWFCNHYDDFAYIDRVTVATFARRHGLASRLYDDFVESLPGGVSVLACEVNIKPPNEPSMRFHARYGFKQVGRQEVEGGSKKVALLVKDL
jgi:hypothetical protein